MIIIGIDPGKKGGIATVVSDVRDPANEIGWIMPKDVAGAAHSLRSLQGRAKRLGIGVVAYVELVHSMPRQGVASTFSFGRGFGEIIGMLAALGIRTELVSPQKWKRAVLAGTDRDKAAAIRFVQENYPDIDLTPGRCRVPQDGIADAVCIAHYGMLQEMKK